jgi:hypothetical protein
MSALIEFIAQIVDGISWGKITRTAKKGEKSTRKK